MQGTRKLCKKYMSQCKMPKCIKENRFCGLQQARYLPCKCKCKAAFHSSQENSTHSWAIYFLPRHQQKRTVLGYTLFTADVPPVVWGGDGKHSLSPNQQKKAQDRISSASIRNSVLQRPGLLVPQSKGVTAAASDTWWRQSASQSAISS